VEKKPSFFSSSIRLSRKLLQFGGRFV